MNFYQKTIPEIFTLLATSQTGLSDSGALLRLGKYGPNRLKSIKKVPLILKFLAQFKGLLVVILIVGAILAFLMGSQRDGYIIFGIVILNAIIGFIQEYKAERILSAFKKHLPSFAKVIRAGKIKKVLTSQIVPGDILYLEAGDSVPADARLIEAYDLKTNDLALTGESDPQLKKAYQIEKEMTVTDIDNMVFMGTQVVEGETKAVAVRTGMETEFGKIARESQGVKQEITPLQKELDHTAKVVTKIALIAVGITLLLFYLLGRDFKESLLLGIAVAVAVVPEGLPAATSIALSLGAQRMLKRKALVKKLLHVESLGSVTTICTDKTGTITTGEMAVVETKITDNEQFLNTLILCNNAALGEKPVGDPLEIALLEYAQKQKMDILKVQKENKKVFEIPFSSKRKMMSVVCVKNKKQTTYVKGGCLEILSRCKISEQEKSKVIQENDEMAKKGLRILAVAVKNIKFKKSFGENKIEKDLTFSGLVGLQDPPREGVKEAIKQCRDAQIKTIMITGDYGLTALAIANQVGLNTKDAKVITGVDLHQMDDESLEHTLGDEVVFARIDPGQKLRIVEALQRKGEIVAVTGDGVNDAPALVKADIGIAMGKIGTDVAKEAADMILLDDHFATIVNAVREGRRIFDNARKFVFYVFASNSGELFVTLFGLLAGLPLPLIAVQILAIDLGTDVFPSLALGVENEEPDIMSGPPRSKTTKIMNVKMLSRLLFIGVTMSLLALGVFLFSLYQGGWQYGKPISSFDPLYFSATASVYATLVFCQIANAFSCRSDKLSIIKIGLFSNRPLLFAELVAFTLLWGMMDFGPMQSIFRTNSPTPMAWLLILVSFFIFAILSEWWKKRVYIKVKA